MECEVLKDKKSYNETQELISAYLTFYADKEEIKIEDINIEEDVRNLIDNCDEEFLILLSCMMEGINKELQRKFTITKRLDMTIRATIKKVELD